MQFDQGWIEFFGSQLSEPYFKDAAAHVQKRRNDKAKVYPEPGRVFEPYKLTPFSSLKAVIMVDEHYTDRRFAGSGLALAVDDGKEISPALKNVIKEVKKSLGPVHETPTNLVPWAQAGILLVTNLLTTEKDRPQAHKNIGWEKFSENLIKYINANKEEEVLFLFWGMQGKKHARHVDRSKHKVLSTSDPARPTHGFSGCNHFVQLSKYVNLWGQNNG